MIIGVAIGAFLSFFVTDLTLYQFSPEFFFFVLLPPIIFEAGYALEKKRFFENIGAITLYAVFGTIISTFTVGMLTFLCAKLGLIDGVSTTNPMESLLFGALISAVDPVATLSIMNNPELQCNKLLYSLVFGEVRAISVRLLCFQSISARADMFSTQLERTERCSCHCAVQNIS
jgi:sodium/hydrogen exchanger 8